MLRRTSVPSSSAAALGGLFVLFALAPAPAQAQRTIGAELGFLDARDFTGASAVGFMEFKSLVFFARGALDIGLGSEDSGVREEGGDCIEIASGDRVNDSRCTTLDGGFTLRGGFHIPVQDKRVQLGLGYRFGSSHSSVIGSGSLRWMRETGWWGVTLEVGDQIVRGTVGIGFDVGGN